MPKGNLTIFCYHGVTDTSGKGIENYSNKHINTADFREQMQIMKDECTVLSMDEVVEHLRTQTPFRVNSVAITFDDGFKNNFTQAAPILHELQLPATFYVTAGMIGTDRMFWVDQIEDTINGCTKSRITVFLEDQKAFCLEGDGQKIDAVEAIKSYCKSTSAGKRDRIIKELIRATGIEPSVDHAQNYQKMSWKEVKQMNDDPLFTIGGHSMYHDIFSSLPVPQMQHDIQASIQLLEKQLGKNIIHYAYPEGGSEHYNGAVINALKTNGIVCCPSGIKGVNEHTTDPFHLKRIMVGFKNEPFPFAKRSVQLLPQQ